MIAKIDRKIKELTERRNEIQELLERTGFHFEDSIVNAEEGYSKRFTLRAGSLKELKMACVMDRFTRDSFFPECCLFELTPENWKAEIESFRPDLLFIESAWEGKDKLWYRGIANAGAELFAMAEYCRDRRIPIVFWNKEDPIYTDAFMGAASVADFVFTTDIDCIQQYKTQLGHERVYHLHFAAQPAIHNPIEKYERKDKFCFAGAYYHRYVERAQVFDSFAQEFIAGKGLDIYDRNYKNARPEHAFPKSYNPYILGKLDPSEIDVAYKGYNYGINMNSVAQSQTMFARRVFELLASNTVTVGNYSRGVKNYFGDLTICTDDAKTLHDALNRYCPDDSALRKYRLAGLRHVLRSHLYADRLAFVVSTVFGLDYQLALDKITVVSRVETESEAKKIAAMYCAQSYKNTSLLLITEQDIETEGDDITLLREEDVAAWSCEGGYIAVFHTEDFYGPNYLLDLLLTTRYGDYDMIGKATYYAQADGKGVFKPSHVYAEVAELSPRRSIIAGSIAREMGLVDIMARESLALPRAFSVDEFNYCEHADALCKEAADLSIVDQGIPLAVMEKVAREIPAEAFDSSVLALVPEQIYVQCAQANNKQISIVNDASHYTIESALPEGQHHYFYCNELIEFDSYMQEGALPVLFEGAGGLDIICVCVFYDKDKNKLAPLYPHINRRERLSVPGGARYMRLGFRPKGPGSCRIRKIIIGASNISQQADFLSRSNVLILSNQYPSPEELYRNMFVHKRVTCYKEEGLVGDIMRMNIYAKKQYQEFEGINVVGGQEEQLEQILSTGIIDTVCVHFLDEPMWRVLQAHGSYIRILVWVHGAEIQPWWRREYNYSTALELEDAKALSEKRQSFWRDVFSKMDQYDIHFIFVSQYFADEIFEDYQIAMPEERYSIIHNCIDVEMFSYVKKPAEQRKKLLSIRPYASNKYANDLTVECLLALSKKEYFKDLDILLLGSGPLFESTLKPLKKFKNIQMKQCFLRQDEIAALHKEYGIFLTPTRMDAQGVSRDEAMASGMVPVTNAVAAIPEFVDESCGILAPGEDYMAMAEGIDRLIQSPELFLTMSENAAKRVRAQTTKEYTIDRELTLIRKESYETHTDIVPPFSAE